MVRPARHRTDPDSLAPYANVFAAYSRKPGMKPPPPSTYGLHLFRFRDPSTGRYVEDEHGRTTWAFTRTGAAMFAEAHGLVVKPV